MRMHSPQQGASRHPTATPPGPVGERDRVAIPPNVLALSAVLVVLGTLAYANSFQVPFLLDDKMHILREPAIRPPLALRRVLALDRPVVSLSLALNYTFGGLDVFGYHLLNLGAHLLCGLVMFGLARYTLRLPTLREQFGGAADALAFVAAGVFVLHPVQTESVTYVIQRAEVFATLAILGGLWLAAIAAQRIGNGQQHPWALLAGLALVSAFGLFSKESVVVLPFLVGLYDWCFIASGRPRTLARHWPIYATLLLVAATAVGLRWWQAAHQGVPLGGVAISLPGAATPDGDAATQALTPRRYLSWQLGVLLYYLRLIVFPDSLCFDCGYLVPWPVRASPLGEAVWVPALVLAGLGVWAWRARPRYPLATFALWASAVALAPTSSVLPLTDVYVEHRLYLPIALVALLAVTAGFSATAALERRGGLTRRLVRAGRLTAALATLVTLGALTIARNTVYADPLRLWEDSVAKAPASERALFNLANEYGRRGQAAQAIATYQAVIRLSPGPAYYINLGQQYLELGRTAEAIDAFEHARARAPTWGIVHRKLLIAYARAGRQSDAIAAGERGTALEWLYAPGYRLLGDAYRRAGRLPEARKAYDTAARLVSEDRQARRGLQAPASD